MDSHEGSFIQCNGTKHVGTPLQLTGRRREQKATEQHIVSKVGAFNILSLNQIWT